jgi:ribosomal-protein-alanine N-acetyltransferase
VERAELCPPGLAPSTTGPIGIVGSDRVALQRSASTSCLTDLRLVLGHRQSGLWAPADAIMSRVAVIRLATVEDSAALAELLRVNREFLAPWEPMRSDKFFTSDGQRQAIEDVLLEHEHGVTSPHVILSDGGIVGRVTLSNIVRGPFQSCNLGYWVDSAHNGRGLATAAVREIVDLAFGELGLHRVEAGTLNTTSARNGCSNTLALYGSASRRPILRSLGGGRITSCTRW